VRAPIVVFLLVVAFVASQTGMNQREQTPVCKTAQLRARLLDSSGAAGTIMLSVTLRNRGQTCDLRGYSKLRLKGPAGFLPTRALHGGLAPLDARPRLVRLAENGKASVLIAYGDVPTGNETSCPKGTSLLLRPPGTSSWLSVRIVTYACNHGTLRESPVLAGVHHAL
jgi:hypothetical protein